MQKLDGQLVYSASDLTAHLECAHCTALNLVDLETPLTRASPDEQMALIQDKGFAHEAAYLDTLRAGAGKIVELSSSGRLAENLALTRAAMADGAGVIFQAALSQGNTMGYADFLRRVDRPSVFGNWSYEVADTKLAHRAKPKFMIQLAHYSALLGGVQQTLPERMHLVFGNRAECDYRVGDYLHYYRRLRSRFESFLAERPATGPEKCDHCGVCDWRERCEAEWDAADHLNRVANITKVQIKRLRQGGIQTLRELANLAPGTAVKGIQVETIHRLRSQASLQQRKRDTGTDLYELLPRNPMTPAGFDRLPEPDDGDLYFDMEGDPLHEGGLEYLFGVWFRSGSKWVFRDFWAHDRPGEKRAFGEFMDFVGERLTQFHGAHIYHYAHYEPNAVRRLMTLHGIREAEVDELLRQKRFVDLYQVVRHALRVSEPAYSIKNLETFYMEKRQGDVTSAGASIVYYEKWRESGDGSLLEKIRAYNEDDCRSTRLLHEWLLDLKPAGSRWAEQAAPEDKPLKSDRIIEHEARLAKYEKLLLNGLPTIDDDLDDEQRLRKLVFHLLDFHRRAEKPLWWALFARQDMDQDELVDDAECIGALSLLEVATVPGKRPSTIATYQYPEQEFKLKQGDSCLRTDTTQRFGTLVKIDENSRAANIKLASAVDVPEDISISSGGPIDTAPIRNALFRLADGLLEGDRFAAALDFLRKAPPRIRGLAPGRPIIDETKEMLPQVIEAVANLDQSTLFIQGPPGAGKTYTGSHLIAELMARGFRVGVTSNSHKAIHNLLHAVEERAEDMKLQFLGIYKGSARTAGSEFDGKQIVTEHSTDDVVANLDNPDCRLLAGTAWLFSDSALEETLDYLFVDEAGQVATANLVAMATSARNIVLLGDQMQLGQPIQGDHPGESGLSSLDFLLEGRATIAADRGVFLATTWRMHPDVCRFISEAIYEGRLHPEEKNAAQRLILDDDAHPALRPTGVVHVPAIHEACSQRSDEEAEIVSSLYDSLLSQRFRDRDGHEHPVTVEDILVVAPYNIQVNLLRRTLPDGARVGTVDKFQGQEAAVVIVSMATSSGDSLPRYIEFLYSKNRLNVAISRARCLAILVASPALADIPCATVKQMGLVNLLCAAISPQVPST